MTFRELLNVGNVDDFIKRCRDLERITRKPPQFEHAVRDSGKWVVRYVQFWPVHHWVPKREVVSTIVEEASVLPCSAIPAAEMVRVTSGGARYFQWLHCLKSDADPVLTSDGLHLDATLSTWFMRAERARNDLNPATGDYKPYAYEFSEERFTNTNQWRCSLYDREHFRSRWEPALKHPEASKRTRTDMVAEALKAAQALCKPAPYEALVRHLASSSEWADKVSIDDLFMAVAHAVAGRDVATGILL